MKSYSSVRKPALAHSNDANRDGADMSVGDVLRKAKRDMFFRRCIIGILLVLLVTFIVMLVVKGYAESLIDYLYAMMG